LDFSKLLVHINSQVSVGNGYLLPVETINKRMILAIYCDK